jgi:hypothetical protein
MREPLTGTSVGPSMAKPLVAALPGSVLEAPSASRGPGDSLREDAPASVTTV